MKKQILCASLLLATYANAAIELTAKAQMDNGFPIEIPCWSKANTIFDYIIVSEMNLQSIFIGYIAICSKRYKIK